MVDRVIDGAVKAGFKVKHSKPFATAPVATKERVFALQVKCRTDIISIVAGHDENDFVGQPFAQEREEFFVEISVRPSFLHRIQIEPVEGQHMVFFQRLAAQYFEGDMLIGDKALLADGFAFA